MSENLIWPLVVIIGAMAWAASYISDVIQRASTERREEHRELIQILEEIKHDIGNIDGNIDGLAQRYDPPDLSAYQ